MEVMMRWIPASWKEKRDKCIFLVRLEAFARGCDLANLYLVNINKDGAIMAFFDQKSNRKNKVRIEILEIERKKEIKLCPVKALEEFMKVEKGIKITIKDNKGEKEYVMLFVKRQGEKIGALTSQRINKITKEILCAAGVEENYGAHSTKHAMLSKAYKDGATPEEMLIKCRGTSLEVLKKYYIKHINKKGG